MRIIRDQTNIQCSCGGILKEINEEWVVCDKCFNREIRFDAETYEDFSIENLYIPRVLVKNIWPYRCNYKKGQIVFGDEAKELKKIAPDFPHLLTVLEWWEHRTILELEVVKYGLTDGGAVFKLDGLNKKILFSEFLPISEEKYNSLNKR